MCDHWQRQGSALDMGCLKTAAQHHESLFNHQDADVSRLSGLNGVDVLSPADGWTGVSDGIVGRFAVRHACFPAVCVLAIDMSGRTVTVDETVGAHDTSGY